MRTMIAVVLALGGALLSACATAAPRAAAQIETAEQCAAEEFRQLDFWIGAWDVRWEASPDQAAGHGVNTITRELSNCVIHEHFDGGPSTNHLIGHSVSTYHAGPGRWRQTWVDNQGGYFALVGGPVGDTFVLESSRLSETSPYLRMVFEDITPTSLTWRWQRSTDGGSSWSDAWVIYYTRHN